MNFRSLQTLDGFQPANLSHSSLLPTILIPPRNSAKNQYFQIPFHPSISRIFCQSHFSIIFRSRSELTFQSSLFVLTLTIFLGAQVSKSRCWFSDITNLEKDLCGFLWTCLLVFFCFNGSTYYHFLNFRSMGSIIRWEKVFHQYFCFEYPNWWFGAKNMCWNGYWNLDLSGQNPMWVWLCKPLLGIWARMSDSISDLGWVPSCDVLRLVEKRSNKTINSSQLRLDGTGCGGERGYSAVRTNPLSGACVAGQIFEQKYQSFGEWTFWEVRGGGVRYRFLSARNKFLRARQIFERDLVCVVCKPISSDSAAITVTHYHHCRCGHHCHDANHWYHQYCYYCHW